MASKMRQFASQTLKQVAPMRTTMKLVLCRHYRGVADARNEAVDMVVTMTKAAQLSLQPWVDTLKDTHDLIASMSRKCCSFLGMTFLHCLLTKN